MFFCENPKDGLYPCGKCRACKKSKANKKMIVSVIAADYYKKMYVENGQFLTLTFNDKYKPDGLDHSIFSSFMKRLRKRDGTPDVKMFMAGEYGETGDDHREHFHVLFYNHKYDIKDVELAWSDPKTGESFGFTYDGTCTPASMKYVSGYIDKKGYDPESCKKPPYGRSSVNIPDNVSDSEMEKISRTGRITFNGHTFSVPEKFRRRYSEIWKKYSSLREDHRRQMDNEEYYKLGCPPRDELKRIRANQAKVVSAQMDQFDQKIAAKKLKRKIKRLQKTLKRRIM